MFKVKLEKKDSNDEFKISKKNVCIVTIVDSSEFQKEENSHAKLVEYFMK